MPSQATITLKTGPDKVVTSLILTNVTIAEINIVSKVLRITCDQGIKEFDMGNIATFTDTITGSTNHTIVASS